MNFLVADDHAIVRKGLVELLHEEYPNATITEVSNSNDALKEARKGLLDIILLDISMPGRNGVETLKQMRSEGIKVPILMLSMHAEDQYALRVLKAGASGFVNKETANLELLSAVSKVLSGRKYITPSLAEKLAENVGSTSDKLPHELLSDREMQVLLLISSGKPVSEIANELSLSVNTISTYRSRILEKLSLQNNAEITRYVIDNGLS